MNDREILEMAARAAGYVIQWSLSGNAMLSAKGHGQRVWNPLTDDGDALRLASDLLLAVNMDCGYTRVIDMQENSTFQKAPGIEATRRAIVRAAAEIGKAM